MLIDAHAHLDLEDYAGDRAETIARAKEAGVERIINVGVDSPRWDSSLALVKQYPGYMYLSLGLHPNDILQEGDPEKVMTRLKELIESNREVVVALGETGLDYYHDDVPPETQKTYFERQIDMARELKLPLVIHCRDAMPDLIRIMQERGRNMPVMMHCFSGSVAEAEECMALGPEVYISLAGPVTFAKAFERHEVARAVPLERLLVETDCPFLTPHPFRGRRNEPARVKLVAERIAELKGISYEEVARQTGQNVQRLFNII
ncbi:MAG TPA: TatD family hydrolase [Chloroflexia bacterium]|nr:TatD family hydrolase [Chloroflexia bacterium]